MSDKYGYIGIETLLNFCSNQKDHCITPNDFMRMNRIKIDERPHGEWLYEGAMAEGHPHCAFNCSVCDGHICRIPNDLPNFCEFCGADMRKKEGEEK